MATAGPMVYPQTDPGRQINSRNWFNENPDPGKRRSVWRNYLSISEEVAKGLEDQVTAKLKDTGLNKSLLTSKKASRLVDRLIGQELARVRSDICRPGIPRDGFLLIIRRTVGRLNTLERQRMKCQKLADMSASEKRATNGDPKSKQTKKLRLDRNMGNTTAPDADSETDSIWDPEILTSTTQRPRRPATSTPAAAAPPTQSDPQSPGQSQLQPQLQSEASQEHVLPPVTPELPPDDAGHMPRSPVPVTLTPDMIKVQLFNDENRNTATHQYLLSELSDQPINISTCQEVSLTKLWSLIRGHQDLADWSFFDESEDFLWCKVNGIEWSIFHESTFALACQELLEEELLTNESKKLRVLYFEIRKIPNDRRKPKRTQQTRIQSTTCTQTEDVGTPVVTEQVSPSRTARAPQVPTAEETSNTPHQQYLQQVYLMKWHQNRQKLQKQSQQSEQDQRSTTRSNGKQAETIRLDEDRHPWFTSSGLDSPAAGPSTGLGA